MLQLLNARDDVIPEFEENRNRPAFSQTLSIGSFLERVIIHGVKPQITAREDRELASRGHRPRRRVKPSARRRKRPKGLTAWGHSRRSANRMIVSDAVWCTRSQPGAQTHFYRILAVLSFRNLCCARVCIKGRAVTTFLWAVSSSAFVPFPTLSLRLAPRGAKTTVRIHPGSFR